MQLDEEDARRRFGSSRIARLATVRPDGAPHLVPVVFAMIDEVIVFAVDHKPKSTNALQRLRNLSYEPRVSFLVDAYDEDWSQLWWVRADAVATLVEPGAADVWHSVVDALTARYEPYRAVPLAGAVVMCAVTRWTGWSARAPV